MEYKLHKLKNGLKVITVPMPSLESATVTVWVGVGSRYEPDSVAGISHFLEHMVFKGSKKRPSAKLISEAVDALGAEFNAATSKEWTNFYIKSRAESLPQAFDVLSDMVLSPLLKEKDIEKEKGVIIEEMNMYEDTPLFKIEEVFEQLIFKGHTLGRDIIGNQKSVRSITQKDFQAFRKRYYYSKNILISVAGGIKENQVLALAESQFGYLTKTSNSNKIQIFKSVQKNPKVKLHSKKKEQAHFILGFLGNPYNHPDRYIESVLVTVLGGGMSSRMFSEVREKRGLAYSVRSTVDRARDTGYISTYAGVDTRKIDEAVKVVLSEHYKMASDPKLTDEELKKAKEFVKGHLALALEDTKSVNSFFALKEILGEGIETPEEVFQAVDRVSKEEVRRVAKELFVPERLNLAIIGPYSKADRFEKLLY